MSGWRTVLPNAWYIAMRELRARIGTRSFVIGTIVLGGLGFVAAVGSIAIEYAVGSDQTSVAVYAEATDLPADAQAVFDSTLNAPGQLTGQSSSSGHKSYLVSWFQGTDPSDALEGLKRGDFKALLIVGRNASSGDLTFLLRTDLPADGRQVQSIATAAYSLTIEDRLARAGTSAAAIFATPAVDVSPVSSTSTTKASSLTTEASSGVISTALIVLIFMAIITYGTWVAMSVAEEKGSRVLELMLNAATPLQMLTGKVLGNALAGLAQYAVVIGALLVGLLARGPIRQAVLNAPASEPPLAGLSAATFGAFLVLFTLGFLLYALLYAALGSLVSRQEDVQSATSPLMALIFIGYFASIIGIQMIDEPWVVALSFVPFFSPYLMLARVMVGSVAPWEFGLVVALMLASIAVALFVASRIYSAGVLMYGQRVGLRQLLRAARVSR
jgi:ABC-2 type transport system permease protein